MIRSVEILIIGMLRKNLTQQTFTCSKSTIETPIKTVTYIES